jgi:hypothetical protein|nr:MAG TPA: hypothetical protein [Caudoviricetes sp.]
MKISQDWGNGIDKITVEADEVDIKKAIRYVTHWTGGDLLLRFESLDTETRDKYIVKIKKYLDDKRR